MNEDLNKWFKEKWVNIGKKVDGKHPPCGTSGEKKGYAKCVPAAKAAGMSKKEKESATRRKRDAQNDADRGGKDNGGQGKKPIYVSTKPKNEDWSQKYKSSIDCNNPKGFSQKAHCQGKKKNENMNIEERLNLFLEKNCPTDPGKWSASKAAAKSKFSVYPSAYANGWAAKNYKGKGGGWKTCSENVVNEVTGKEAKEIAKLTGTRDSIVQKFIDDFNLNAKNLFNFIAKGKEKVRKDFATAMSGRPGNKYQGDFVGMFGEGIVNEACWEGYKQVGGKMKNGRMVPNCVPISEAESAAQQAAIAINMKKKGIKPKTEDINNDYDELDVEPEEIDDFIDFLKAYKNTLDEGCQCLTEAEYQGRQVSLGKPMQGDVKKFKVYVKNPAGNVVKVNFGQKGMKIRKSNPAARKSFRARMNCDNPGPRTKANYWSCRKW
jgi:hypothetical protein